MNKEKNFLTYAFILWPWVSAVIVIIMYLCVHFIFEYTSYENQVDTGYKKIRDNCAGIHTALFFTWFGSLLFTVLAFFDLVSQKKLKKHLKESAILLSGHLVYLYVLTSDIGSWWID